MAEQRQIRFIGNVQGVGFRWNTQRVARGYDVSGYVENLPDGSVQLVAEGEPAELNAFLDEIRSRMGGHIRNEQSRSAPATGQHQGFTIRH